MKVARPNFEANSSSSLSVRSPPHLSLQNTKIIIFLPSLPLLTFTITTIISAGPFPLTLPANLTITISQLLPWSDLQHHPCRSRLSTNKPSPTLLDRDHHHSLIWVFTFTIFLSAPLPGDPLLPCSFKSSSATSSLPLFGSGEQQLPRWLLASSLMDCNISFQSWASSSSPFLSWSTPSAKIIFIGTFCPSWSSNEAASSVLSLFVVAVLLPSSDHLLRHCCAQSSLWWSFIRRFNPSPRQAQQLR